MLKQIKERALTLGHRLRDAARVPLSARLAKFSDVFELGGVGCLVGGTFMWHTIAGMFALGGALIWLGWVTHESQ